MFNKCMPIQENGFKFSYHYFHVIYNWFPKKSSFLNFNIHTLLTFFRKIKEDIFPINLLLF